MLSIVATRQWLLFVLGCCGLGLVGCGGNPRPIGKVTGKVSFQGQPVNGGTLLLLPLVKDGETEPGEPAAGSVQPDGTFVVGTYSDRDGAIVGRHRVTFTPASTLPDGAVLTQPGESPPPSPYAGLIPREVEAEVQAGNNEINVELVPASQNSGN